MSSTKNIPYIFVLQSSEQLHSWMQIIFFYEHFELNHFVTISTDDEINVGIETNDVWNQTDEQINSFTIL